MDEHAAVGWLHRRAGFGLHPDQLATAVAGGSASEQMRLFDEAGNPTADPWADVDLGDESGDRRGAIAAWARHLVGTVRPFTDRLTWQLHGWLVSSLAKVVRPRLMADQIRLFMRSGTGSYPDLLRAVAVDPAMLVYLDGRTSTGRAPNENFGRELLELFALGVGNYTEDDVKAAARALTGWVVVPGRDDAFFVTRRHDDHRQILLGAAGVHDVDTVVDAVVAHPAHARFVADRITRDYLGDPTDPALDGVVDELASTYETGDRRLDATVTRALQLGLAGASAPLVVTPVPWLVGALRTCGVGLGQLGPDAIRRVPELGQIPLLPPDVSGWPRGEAWFGAGSLVARTNLAASIAVHTGRDQPIRIAIDDGDLDLVARHLGHAEPFGPATAAVMTAEPDPVERLTLALVCPENLIA